MACTLKGHHMRLGLGVELLGRSSSMLGDSDCAVRLFLEWLPVDLRDIVPLPCLPLV